MSYSPYQNTAITDANAYGVPSQLYSDIIQQESGYNPNAYNLVSGATGIAQILPSTAANPGYGLAPVDPNNPNASLSFGAQYLAALFAKLGSWTGAVQAYSGSGTGTPYPGNAAIASDLAAADAGNVTTLPTTTVTAAKAQGAGCSSLFFTPLACAQFALEEMAFILLGIVAIGVGLWMLADSNGKVTAFVSKAAAG